MRNSKQTVQLPTNIEHLLEQSDLPSERLSTVQSPQDGWPDVFLALSRTKATQRRTEVLYCTQEQASDVERLLIESGIEYRREYTLTEVEDELAKEYRRATDSEPDVRRQVPTRPGDTKHAWKFLIKIS